MGSHDMADTGGKVLTSGNRLGGFLTAGLAKFCRRCRSRASPAPPSCPTTAAGPPLSPHGRRSSSPPLSSANRDPLPQIRPPISAADSSYADWKMLMTMCKRRGPGSGNLSKIGEISSSEISKQDWKVKCKRRGKDPLLSNEKQKTLKTSLNHSPGSGNLSKIGECSSSEIRKQAASEVSLDWKMLKTKRRDKDTLWSNEKLKTFKTSFNLVCCDMLLEPGPGSGNLSKIGESSSSEISKQVALEVSRSVVSIASFIGDELMYECTGMFIEGSCADVTSILTVASLVGTIDLAIKPLTIKVRLPNKQVVTGWLHNSDLDYDIAVVNIKSTYSFQTVDLNSNHQKQFDTNHKVLAMGRCFESGLLKSSNGIVLCGPTDEDPELIFSTCKTDLAWIGGPLVDYEGNFVGMNCCSRGEKTAFLPKNKIAEKVGPLRDSAAGSIDDLSFTRWQPDTSAFYDDPKLYKNCPLKRLLCELNGLEAK